MAEGVMNLPHATISKDKHCSFGLEMPPQAAAGLCTDQNQSGQPDGLSTSRRAQEGSGSTQFQWWKHEFSGRTAVKKGSKCAHLTGGEDPPRAAHLVGGAGGWARSRTCMTGT